MQHFVEPGPSTLKLRFKRELLVMRHISMTQNTPAVHSRTRPTLIAQLSTFIVCFR